MLEIILTVTASIILPVIFWLYTPHEIKKSLFKNKSNTNTKFINYDKFIEDLQKYNVSLNNDEKLSSEHFIKEMKYVYFPVVPRRELNIIHLTFSKVIKNLEKLGLKVIIFIFDDYYGKIKNLDFKVRDEHIINFVNSLRSIGINSKIVFESKVYDDKKYAQKLLKKVLKLSSIFSVKEIENLNSINKYISKNAKHIRHEKIFLNIANFMCLDYKFGYILSGADETKMWQDFIKVYGDRCGRNIDTEVVLLSIPKVYNIKGEVSNVLDTLSFSYTNNKKAIKITIEGNLKNKDLIRKDCGIFYILQNLYFEEKKELILHISDSDIKKYKNIDALIEYCKINNVDTNQFFIESLYKVISKIYHNME